MSEAALGSRLPLFISMLAFTLACLVAAVLVNIGIIFALPAPAPEIYQLRDVETLLQGKPAAGAERSYSIRQQPAAPSAPETTAFRIRVQQRLARDLGVNVGDVVFTRPEPGPILGLAPNFDVRAQQRWRALRQQTLRLFDQPPGPDQVVLIGPFIVAKKSPDGGWRVLETKSRQLLDPWRAGALIWILASVAALTPLAYLFARRISAPISAFAAAADRLGRDPNAPPLELKGPAEIGVATRAFNEMQERLRRYVQDRTTMIGAVAHDLRTPLTRLRFHIESAPPELRRKMAADNNRGEPRSIWAANCSASGSRSRIARIAEVSITISREVRARHSPESRRPAGSPHPGAKHNERRARGARPASCGRGAPCAIDAGVPRPQF